MTEEVAGRRSTPGLLRDHLHAATAIGRMAAAAKAVELGYGIEPDPGPSGRLGGSAISGIPKEAWEVHATRSAQIDAAVGREASYQSRADGRPTTRDKKEHEQVEDLLPRWRAELANAGTRRGELAAAVERAGPLHDLPPCAHRRPVAEELLSPGGRLAAGKTFDPPRRGGGGGAAPPRPACLNVGQRRRARAFRRAGRRPASGSRCPGPVWAAACVLEDERRVAELADQLVQGWSPAVPAEVAASAVGQTELARAPVSMRDRPKWPRRCSLPGLALTC